LELLIFNTNGA